MIALFVCAVALTAGMSFAADGEITIGCGGASGAYTRQICPAIKTAMEARGFTVNTFEAEGSGANIADIKSGKRTAGLVQMDVLAKQILEYPELKLYLPLGQISPEALFVVIKDPAKGGRITDWNTLAQDYPDNVKLPKPFEIGVAGSEKSGSYLTMQTITQAIPPLQKNIKLIPLGTLSPQVAYNYLNSGAMDAVAFVMMPDIENERIAMVLKSKVWKFLDIDDQRIATIQFNSLPVYSIMEIPLKGTLANAWGALKSKAGLKGTPTLKTPVTMATLLVNPRNAPENVFTALSEVANSPELLSDDTATGVAKRWFDTAVTKLKQ